jgi:glycosyltransferase involved in cell wall biosynthesis
VRIGIDAAWAGVVGTGTSSYTRGLVSALASNESLELFLYFRSEDRLTNPLFRIQSCNVHRRIVDGLGQPGRSLLSLAAAAARDGLDVFHSPGYFLPLWRGPKVVTFHDVNMFLQWDKWWRPGMRASWASLCAQTLISSRLASRVLADSEFSACAIGKTLRIASSRIKVLHPGVDDVFFAPRHVSTGMRERNDLNRYILSVGVLSPQKNLEGMVRAFSGLDDPELKFAIVGRKDGPYFDQVIAPLVRQLRLEQKVVCLGVVDQVDLVELYRGADAFLYPSFAEGFGLPPLEAMACDLPVVASNTSCLPEILGDAALLVDPLDPNAIGAALESVLSQPALRSELILRGQSRAARFLWKNAAENALDVYAQVA